MTPLSWRLPSAMNWLKEATLVVAICSATLAPSCGKSVTVFHQFDLQACPEESFSLPSSVDQAPYHLSMVRPSSKYKNTRCPGYKLYELRDTTRPKESSFFYIRINRGPSCSLDVGYRYLGPTSGEPAPRIEERETPLVGVVAELLLKGSTVVLKVPAAKVERLQSEAQRERCMRSADQSERTRASDGGSLACSTTLPQTTP